MSKVSKLRHCPALGRGISPADCGEQRQGRLACPADCSHNPFNPANYSQLLEIEDRFDAKSVERLLASASDAEAMKADIVRAKAQGIHAIQAFFTWKLFIAEDADKTTFARRWEQTGWLRNSRMTSAFCCAPRCRCAWCCWKFDGFWPASRIEAVDLLSPNPDADDFTGSQSGRDGRAFLDVSHLGFPLPHYWRLSGTGTTIPDVAQFTAPEIVREIVQHLGGPLAEAEMRRWLAEHFPRFDAALQAVSRLRRQQMLAGMDAKSGKAVYELRAPFAQCRERLDMVAEVEPDDLSAKEQDEGFAEAARMV